MTVYANGGATLHQSCLTVFFFFFSTEKVPTKEQLYQCLLDQYEYIDVILPSQCPYALYEGVVRFWKQQHRSSFVDCLAQQVVAAQRLEGTALRPTLDKVLQRLRPPWVDGDGSLAQDVYEKLALCTEEVS